MCFGGCRGVCNVEDVEDVEETEEDRDECFLEEVDMIGP